MRKFTFIKSLFLAVALLAGNAVWGTTVNYAMSSLGLANSTLTGTGSYTVDAVISVSFEKNSSGTAPTYYSADGVRLYQHATKGGSMKISVANGYKITDVVVTRASGDGDGPAGYSIDNTIEVGSFVDGTITNSINNISATNYIEYYSKGTSSKTRSYIVGIAVTYIPTGSPCTSPDFLFDETSVTKLITDGKFTNDFISDNTSEMVWSSSDTNVATVNPSTGEVTIVGAGTTNIKVTQIPDGTYCAIDESYTLTVTPTTPTLTVTELTVPEMTVVTGLTDTETVNVSGAALTADILVTIDGADAAMFSVLPASIAQSAGEASGAVTVTYSPTAPGTHTATLKFNSTGATEVTRTLTGTSTMATPVAIDGSGVSQTGFTANWNAVAGATEYELSVYTKTTGSATTILSENFDGFSAGSANANANSTDVSGSLNTYTQTSGWTGNKVYQAGGTAKMGGGSALGYITTPAIDLSGADITLDFKAMAWSGDATELKVFLDNNLIYTVTGLNNTDYTLSPYSTTITGGTANSKIRFEAKQTSSARFFIDDVVIAGKPSTSTPIAGSPFTVTGETSKAIADLTAGTTYYYTVVAKNGSVATAVSNEVAVTTSTGTGLSNTVKNMNLRAVNGNIVLNAEAGQLVEVYNSIGQKVGSRLTSEGVNTIPARVKGVVFVKIGSEVSKLIME
ncbi:MAG: hypothetical protein EOM47_09560 [Bacteroidia bacterium]|nr:hypothetical protein [Bacteroidia bacterium]